MPFSTWSLTKLAEFLVAEGVVNDIGHEGLRDLLRKEDVSFQVIKTWKASNDPDYEPKKNRVLELYDIADGKMTPDDGDPDIVFCVMMSSDLSNLLPRRLFAALNLMTGRMYGHVKVKVNRTTFLASCRYLRSLYPPEVRIAIVMDNFSPHLSTQKDNRVGVRAETNNVELAYVPANAWLNRIECQFLA